MTNTQPDAMPKVSVIVTTYNQEDTISESLESILAQQTDFPFEIELADDCSTDSTPDICRRYADRYPGIIRYTHNPANRGCRDNYFDTLLRCRAPYIADLAGDDVWTDPHKLAKQAAILDAEPGVTLVHTAWQYLHADSGKISPAPFSGEEKWRSGRIDGRSLLYPLLTEKNAMAVHSCTAMYRKEIFLHAYNEEENLFRNPDYPCEDLQLIAAIAFAGDVAFIPDITLNYRIGGDRQMTSVSDRLRAFRFNLGTLRLRLRLQRKYGIVSPAVDRNIRSLAAYTVGLAFHAADIGSLSEISDFCKMNRISLPLTSRTKLWLRHLPHLQKVLSHI